MHLELMDSMFCDKCSYMFILASLQHQHLMSKATNVTTPMCLNTSAFEKPYNKTTKTIVFRKTSYDPAVSFQSLGNGSKNKFTSVCFTLAVWKA